MEVSYAVVSILAYIDPLQTSLKYECCMPHFTFRWGRAGGIWWGGGGGGMKKYGFKEGESQEKHITYWV